MTVPERLEAMELLWTSLCRSGNAIPSPAWHGEMLAARQAKVKEGRGDFLSLTELRKRLKQGSE